MRQLARALLNAVDPRLAPKLVAELDRRLEETQALPATLRGHVVLVGHRAAGKTTLLPLVAQWLRREAVDLDRTLEKQSGRWLKDWVRDDEPSFRAAERATFQGLPGEKVVAAGGGFLSLHTDLLAGHTPVLVPVSFQTYRERLLADTHRPRLMPALSLEEEISTLFQEREQLHARAQEKLNMRSLVELLLATWPQEAR